MQLLNERGAYCVQVGLHFTQFFESTRQCVRIHLQAACVHPDGCIQDLLLERLQRLQFRNRRNQWLRLSTFLTLALTTAV